MMDSSRGEASSRVGRAPAPYGLEPDMAKTVEPGHSTAAAAQIGGPERGPDRRADPGASCHDQLGNADLDGRSVCVLVPDATRSCPLPLLLVGRPRGAARSRQSSDGARCARHPRHDERAGARRAPGLRARGVGRSLSGDDGAQPRVVGTRRRSPMSGRSARSGSPSCRTGCCTTPHTSGSTAPWSSTT